ncbi:D-galactonate dehydratase [compost metagenome]
METRKIAAMAEAYDVALALHYEDSYFKIPGCPGPGIEIDEAHAAECASVRHRWRNPMWRHADGSVTEW